MNKKGTAQLYKQMSQHKLIGAGGERLGGVLFLFSSISEFKFSFP